MCPLILDYFESYLRESCFDQSRRSHWKYVCPSRSNHEESYSPLEQLREHVLVFLVTGKWKAPSTFQLGDDVGFGEYKLEKTDNMRLARTSYELPCAPGHNAQLSAMDRINTLVLIDWFTVYTAEVARNNQGSSDFSRVIELFLAKVPDPKTLEKIEAIFVSTLL
jgi:hypothetical protein